MKYFGQRQQKTEVDRGAKKDTLVSLSFKIYLKINQQFDIPETFYFWTKQVMSFPHAM